MPGTQRRPARGGADNRAGEAKVKIPRRAQRWERARFSRWIERTYPPGADLAHEPWCARWHAGPCDWWAVCTGMAYGLPEREAAGAAHPWRRAA